MPPVEDAAPIGSEARQLADEQARLAVAQGRRARLPSLVVDLALVGLVLSLGASAVLWFFVPWQAVFLHGRHLLLDRRTRQGVLSLVVQHRWLARTGLFMAVGFAALQVAAFQQPVQAQHFLITMCLFGVVSGGVATAAGDLRGYIAVVLLLASANALCWLAWGGPLGWLPALAMFVLVTTTTDQVRNQRDALRRQVRLRMQLDAALRDSQQAIEARTRFFAAASHDLRQPLTALGYNVATLEALARQGEDVPPAQLAVLAGGLRRSLRESQALLGSLLEVSQLDAGAVEAQLQPVALVPLITDLLALLRPEAEQRGLRLRFEPPADDAMGVRSDPVLLRRVLQNLIGNALKFTQQGQVAVELARLDGGEVLLRVRDTGPGIEPALQERVFEEFFQVGNPGRNRSQGLGLGLAIVRRLLQLLGHPMSLESRPGQGSCFSLQLPAEEASRPRVARKRDGPLPDRSRPLRVLVVDDEPPIRDALAGLLGTLGWQVRTAADPPQALQQLADGWQPEALVLDFRLGEGVSGLDVLALLRRHGCQAPAWLVTADTSPERIQQAREAGLPVRYKPVDGLALAEEIHAAVG